LGGDAVIVSSPQFHVRDPYRLAAKGPLGRRDPTNRMAIMSRSLRAILLIAGLCCVVAMSASAKDKAKAPPKKDPPSKTTSCPGTSGAGKAKTADKAFNSMNCYIRG
jgi:hypothetical protein